jgi:hypothetical protein
MKKGGGRMLELVAYAAVIFIHAAAVMDAILFARRD